jgi:hypothetical protein
MTGIRNKVIICSGALLSILCADPASASTKQLVRLAYFEGGAYPVHSVLRDEFHRQLERL